LERENFGLTASWSKHTLLVISELEIDCFAPKAVILKVVIFPLEKLSVHLNHKGGKCTSMEFVLKTSIGQILGSEYQKLLLKKPLSSCFAGFKILPTTDLNKVAIEKIIEDAAEVMQTDEKFQNEITVKNANKL